MSAQKKPLVSCICVTHHNVEILKRSIQCFQDQTYINKEIIVAFESDREDIANYLGELKDSSIRSLLFSKEMQLTLGEKRNLAIESANGFYLCVWDDDDWYNIKRIEIQIQSLKDIRYKSSVLSNIILYDGKTQEAYLSATRWAWEQTLFCEKSIFENSARRYENVNRGEDSPLLYNLKQNDFLSTISHPDLYIYVYHGRNAFHRGHWEVNLLYWAKKLPADQSSAIQNIVEGKVSNYEGSALLKTFLQPGMTG